MYGEIVIIYEIAVHFLHIDMLLRAGGAYTHKGHKPLPYGVHGLIMQNENLTAAPAVFSG